MQPIFESTRDRGEDGSRMKRFRSAEEPALRGELTQLALAPAQVREGLRPSLPTHLIPCLATLVPAMNCHRSNLIERHHTHPIDMERALEGHCSTDPDKCDLQLAARAPLRLVFPCKTRSALAAVTVRGEASRVLTLRIAPR